MFAQVARKLFGSRNDREIKRIAHIVNATNALEGEISALSDAELKNRYTELRQRFRKEADAQVAGLDLEIKEIVKLERQILDRLAPEVFAVVREAGKRVLKMRHFDVQLIGGMVLHEGKIAEMKTGEGKTLVATLPVCLNALAGRGVHVVTVNDYLATRDAEWMGKLYGFLGLTVGVIRHADDSSDPRRRLAYQADITYGTNNEFGFDYLRDNMKYDVNVQAQRPLHFAIVDEVDSILIDEARTPLIISGQADESTELYKDTDAIVPKLIRAQDYTVDEKSRTVVLTEEGIDHVENLLGVKDLYDPRNIETLHHLNQSLRAHALYKLDRDYVVKGGEVIIVDEFTGRLMPGRRWGDGLHQAVEAKEKVTVRQENRTLATITFQNFFKLYNKLSGMTGTADTEAPEFAKIYDLEVLVIPTNRDNIRKDFDDVVYKTEREKFDAVVKEIEECHAKGQPVLVGTVSIEKSEKLSRLIKKHGIPHNVLNAKQHEREAHIVAQAGRKGAVTISTNMAGRGTDILLGGNPAFLAADETDRIEDPVERETKFAAALKRWQEKCAGEHDEVIAAGGLHILGTERHESRRIDNQLRGRAARQGDPGSTHFFLSLEDDLMRIFGTDRIKNMMETLGMEDGEPIEHPWVTKAIGNAQKKVEGHNFDIRKNLFEYDETMNLQRKATYGWRQIFLEGRGTREETLAEIEEFVGELIAANCDPRSPKDEWNLAALAETVERVFDIKLFESPEEERRATSSDLGRVIVERAFARYEAREAELSPELMRGAERHFHLQAIDKHWVDHLSAMEALREGVGLRGYGQKDPKLEYKKEGYAMFREMEHTIKSDVLLRLYRARPTVQQPATRIHVPPPVTMRAAVAGEQPTAKNGAPPHSAPPAPPHRPQPSAAEAAASLLGGAPRPARSVRTNLGAAGVVGASVQRDDKVGRNDPCPCGSGKKYKKCHGTEA